MPIEILMPALSPTMTEGNLATWSVSEGDTVSAGDVIAEIETDKATMEVEAVDEGTIGKIVVPAGTSAVAVNSVIALLLEEGEDASALEGYTSSNGGADSSASNDAKTEEASDVEPGKSAPAASNAPKPAASTTSAPVSPSGERVFASPLARRIATDKGLDLKAISGTGPHGRIVKRDVENAKPSAASASGGAVATPGFALPESGSVTEIPNSTMRKVIATRLQEAKQTIPHFYLSVDCRIDALLDMRKTLNAAAPEGDGAYKLSVNDLIIKAVAKGLVEVPAANAMWTDEAIHQFNTVDISVAVATPSGLITPIIRHADHKGLAAISNEIKELAGRAKDGKLMPEEYTGGGFTISNLGMFGVKDFAAIINPPQSCILAVGAGEQQPIVVDGQLAVGTVMTCTLSVDHRSVDGAVGAQFLAAFKRIIENPALLAL